MLTFNELTLNVYVKARATNYCPVACSLLLGRKFETTEFVAVINSFSVVS